MLIKYLQKPSVGRFTRNWILPFKCEQPEHMPFISICVCFVSGNQLPTPVHIVMYKIAIIGQDIYAMKICVWPAVFLCFHKGSSRRAEHTFAFGRGTKMQRPIWSKNLLLRNNACAFLFPLKIGHVVIWHKTCYSWMCP